MSESVFAERVCLVTGAASGIGAALCRRLAAAGARIVAADIDLAGAERLVEEIASGGQGRAVRLDVRDREAFIALARDLATREGRIDHLFNNAGILVLGNVLRMEPGHWDSIVDVNIRGVHHGIEAVYPLMVEQGHGHILNTASMAGLVPSPGFTAYTMTKHAVVGLSTALRVEAARHGVGVSALCPGIIDTNMAETAQLLGHTERLKEEMPEAERGLHSPDYCARKALAGVRRNRAIIPVTPMAHVGWRLYRLWPGLMAPVLRVMATRLAPMD